MLVSEMRRQEATYFLMNWETRGSEQGLTEEWAGGLCSWPGSVAEGQHQSVTSHPASHQDPPHPPYTPAPWGLLQLPSQGAGSFPAALPGLGTVLCTMAHTGHLGGQPTGQTEAAPGGECHHAGSNLGPRWEKSRLSNATSYTPSLSPSTLHVA